MLSHFDAWNQWRLRVRVDPAIAAEALSYPSDDYIRWYRGITRVYIGNSANCDTRSNGYQPDGVDRRMMTSKLQEVDDMASVVIREPHSSPSQMAVTKVLVELKGVLGDILGVEQEVDALLYLMLYKGTTHVDPDPAVVERGEGSGSGQPYVDAFDSPNLYMPSFFGFRAPPPLGTASSSTPHQPISQASSSDEEERQDDMDGVQPLDFEHRVGKKTMRFTPSD
ncbi:hypothetical protein M9H77_22588 [Catharanthus roseus]|uniref:Uncharacterized protein n=1 Tax=Catharanthus roseus TaxID=4058 RepID=A0ACC0AQW7_CATRO|nr:hypothetical protein M9H77_22588 [Catharanthus roseus]